MTPDEDLYTLIQELSPYLAGTQVAETLKTVGAQQAPRYSLLLTTLQERQIVPTDRQLTALHRLARAYDMRAQLLQIQWRNTQSAGCSDCD